jgi:hypothetical protein
MANVADMSGLVWSTRIGDVDEYEGRLTSLRSRGLLGIDAETETVPSFNAPSFNAGSWFVLALAVVVTMVDDD